ncbi:MAG: RiPP maturation radical SAM C-methyltransferase [Magnetococcales bacterium]|nr:RiPP maturation radical SAM C-methyltransferase [Magnetococcales bacterium]
MPETCPVILFPVMPFTSTLMPSPALGQFKAQLQQAGLPCRVVPCNVDFMREIGLGSYEIICKQRGINAQLGEWLFAPWVWDEPPSRCGGPTDEAFFANCALELDCLRHPDPKGFLLEVRDRLVPRYLERCVEQLKAIDGVKAFGFSCLFYQTMASAALARRLKEALPDRPVAFGGASFHGEMGEEILRVMPWIDAVSVGEADDVIVPLFKAFSEGRPPEGLQGVIWRDAQGGLHRDQPHRPVSAAFLDTLPPPDYSDYFQSLAAHGLLENPETRVRIHVPYETSRGCWWGEKRHCTFCGFNAEGMSFRAKSPEVALELVRHLRRTSPVEHFMATDNILPHDYYDTFLPRLAEDPCSRGLSLYVEVKPNLTRERVRRLAAAGVRIAVPGIESLSSHLLRCLQKGATGLMSVLTLKLFREYGILPSWSLLMRIPGERQEDYARMVDQVPSLVHFWPPFGGPRPMELHRFSPYFFETERYTTNQRPHAWYRSIFPPDRVDLSKVAYYFDADWKDVLPEGSHEALTRRVWQWVDIWKQRPRLPRFSFEEGEDNAGLTLEDTRFDRHRTWTLDAMEAAAFRAIDEPATVGLVRKRLAQSFPETRRVEGILQEFVTHRLAMEEEGRYLSLALPAGLADPPLSFRRAFLQRVEQDAERKGLSP